MEKKITKTFERQRVCESLQQEGELGREEKPRGKIKKRIK